jgi:hypothetical protein
MRAMCVSGRIFAKDACPVEASNTRAILTQPVLLQLSQAILSEMLHDTIIVHATEYHLQTVVLGAFKRHQVMEIAQSLQLVV